MNEILKAKGTIELRIFEGNKLIKEIYEENLITSVGLAHIISTIGNGSGGINRIYLGSGTTPATVNDTALVDRFLDLPITSKVFENNKVRFLLYIPENTVTSNKTLKEIGLVFKDANNDKLITRATFTDNIIVTVSQSLSLSYNLTIN